MGFGGAWLITRKARERREARSGPEVPSAPRDRREAICVALAGVSAELARLPWDWGERTAEERMRDRLTPLFDPGPPMVDLRRFTYEPGAVFPVSEAEFFALTQGAIRYP